MPRVYKKEVCDECRRRKVKCDEVRPVCGRCARNGTFCTRANPQALAIHPAPLFGPPGPPGPFIPATPREALLQPGVAPLFHRYVSTIASWYDLGDPERHFATSVPRLALDEPLLFSGVIAVAGMHHGKTTAGKPALATARAYHAESVGRLIRLDETSGLLENGVALATVCLLRSYEILDEDDDPNRHLQGAYSLASRRGLHNDPSGPLLTAGFWNYLREDITFSLFTGYPLKMDLSGVTAEGSGRLHGISLILGRIINAAFAGGMAHDEWDALMLATKAWYEELPAVERPCARIAGAEGELPSVWFIEDSHASAMHYFLVACHILAVFASPARLSALPPAHEAGATRSKSREDMLEAYATEICAVAFTARIPSVLVNAFGPIAYSAKHVRNESVRQGVIGNLTGCKRVIGWPVARLIDGLRASWAASVP